MVTAQQLVTVGGIPAHPLVVHAVVVLLPLAGLCSMLIAVRPSWRRRYGGAVAVLTVLAVAAVPVAQQTGRQLEARLTAVVDNPLITVVSAVLVVLAAVTVIGLVVWIGHSGSVAVWGGLG